MIDDVNRNDKRKSFSMSVELKFDNLIEAKDKEEAISILKNSFEEEFGMLISDDEIVKVEEVIVAEYSGVVKNGK